MVDERLSGDPANDNDSSSLSAADLRFAYNRLMKLRLRYLRLRRAAWAQMQLFVYQAEAEEASRAACRDELVAHRALTEAHEALRQIVAMKERCAEELHEFVEQIRQLLAASRR